MEVLLMFLIFFVLLFSGVPVSFSLGCSVLSYFVLNGVPIITLPQKMFAGMNSFVLLCVPGFILAGNLMNQGGITNRIIDFSNALVGHLRGGLGHANVVASMVFAGISGTATADSASLGAILIPAMEKDGYDTDFSCAITAASSCIGPIIPPSLPMIVAATLTGLSVSKMFVAGIIPGLLLGFGMMGVCYIISKKRNYPKRPRQSWKQRIHAFFGAIWALGLVFVILYGIMGGMFTPTEASIIAVLYALFVGLFVYKELPLKKIPQILKESACTTTSILLLIGFANAFAWVLSREQIPTLVANGMLSLTQNKYIILLLINILLLFVGTFMETNAALAILFPTLLQVATSVGVNPIHFGVMVVLNLVLGLTTPPVGVCLFITASIGKLSIGKVAKALLPFLAINLVVLMAVTYIEPVTMFMVKLFYP